MGNWHCIPSSCGEVVYQEYEPPRIRWRYGIEPWQEIIADNYTIHRPLGQCFTAYDVTVKAKILQCYQNQIVYDNQSTKRITGQIIGVDLRSYNGFSALLVDYKTANGSILQSIVFSTTRLIADTACFTNSPFPTNSNRPDHINKLDSTYQITNIVRVDGQPDNCGNCVFKITKNGQTVHTETRSVCPEVEKIPCKLSSVNKSIKIKKLPYLEKIEVVPYQYSTYRSPGIPAPIVQTDKIPTECLNIYNNAIFVIPPTGQGIYPNATPFDSLVTQICSYPGCPSPEYQVICDCGESCKSCPENTCAVECDGHICCYDDSGISVKSIARSEYCGGGS